MHECPYECGFVGSREELNDHLDDAVCPEEYPYAGN